MRVADGRKRRACLTKVIQRLQYGFQRQMQEQELAR